MNKLWVRMSLTFSVATIFAVVFIFSLFFILSWTGEPESDVGEYQQIYRSHTAPFVESYIIAGKDDAEIMALLDTDTQLQTLLERKREDGFASGVDIEDRSFGRIAGDYLRELISPELLQTILVGSVFGSIVSIWLSRQLVSPLAELTLASHTLGQSDLSHRVNVQGSDEINELSATFNNMAAQLEQNEKVRQNMLADVSHELRTPLAGLEGTLRATLDGVFDLDQQHVSNLYQQTCHLSRLVEDLHLLSRAEAQRLTLDKTQVDLAVLLNQVIDVFIVLADEAEVVMKTKIEPVPSIEADASRIRQVVSNLLNNALRHTPKGGTITLTLQQNHNEAKISVKDTGEGIVNEHLPFVFDRFYRADKSRARETGGSGLGLAITQALVEAHGGNILVESHGINQGANFMIRLPLSS